jgi:L-lactate utilization protein LutB
MERGYHGLYIEMKSSTGKLTPAQQAFMEAVIKEGFRADVCRSAEEATKIIEEYIKSKA